MKKIIIVFIAFAILVPGNRITGAGTIMSVNHCHRLYMYDSGYRDEPDRAILFKTYQELDGYYKYNKEKYGFDSDNPYAKGYKVRNFRDKINADNNDKWFEKHDLVIFVSTHGSSSYFYRLKSKNFIQTKIYIVLLIDAPKNVVNCAMAGWHTFIEIEKRDTTLSAEISVVNK